MTLLALTELWNEIYAAGGFFVGVVSLLLGAVAFYYTLRQVREARDAANASRSAADAARAAAERTLAESKVAHGKFIGVLASRMLSALKAAVNDRNWSLAAVRADDLAEFIASAANEGSDGHDLARQLRAFGQKFAAGSAGSTPKYYPGKWNELVLELHAYLDRVNAPFGGEGRGQTDSTAGRAGTP